MHSKGEVKAVVTFVQLGWVRLEIFKRKILNESQSYL